MNHNPFSLIPGVLTWGIVLWLALGAAPQEKQSPRVVAEHSPDSGRTWNTISSAPYSGGVLFIWRRDTTLATNVPVPFMRVLWPVIQCQNPTRIGE